MGKRQNKRKLPQDGADASAAPARDRLSALGHLPATTASLAAAPTTTQMECDSIDAESQNVVDTPTSTHNEHTVAVAKVGQT